MEMLPWWAFLLAGVSFWIFFSQVLPSFEQNAPWDRAILTDLGSPIGRAFMTVFSLVAFAKFLAAWRRRRLLESQTNLESLRRSTWQDFERIVGEIYRRKGYAVLETGKGGADGGVDLKLSKEGEVWLVQCKRWSREQVGVALVRELLGVVASEKATGGILITTSVFTPDAEAFARRNPIRLVSGKELIRLVLETKKSKQDAGEAVPDLGPSVIDSDMRSPVCGWCGSGMVRRTAAKGKSPGKKFWGCVRYPKCRFTRDDS